MGRNYQDSGNEEEDEEEERALVISEQSAEEEQAEEEAKDRVTEDTVYDFSTTKKTNQEAFGDTNKEKQPTGIKIKDFARLDMPAAAPVEPKDIPPVLEARDEDEDDVESEPESDCASVDTWSSSLAEDKLFSGTDPVIRRIRSTSSGDSVYQCDFCEKLFTNKYHLQSHLVVHTGERAFVCKTCKKTFGRKSTLRAHMTTHTKVSNFMCTVCEKACNDNNSLEEHMRMHTGNNFGGTVSAPGLVLIVLLFRRETICMHNLPEGVRAEVPPECPLSGSHRRATFCLHLLQQGLHGEALPERSPPDGSQRS